MGETQASEKQEAKGASGTGTFPNSHVVAWLLGRGGHAHNTDHFRKSGRQRATTLCEHQKPHKE